MARYIRNDEVAAFVDEIAGPLFTYRMARGMIPERDEPKRTGRNPPSAEPETPQVRGARKRMHDAEADIEQAIASAYNAIWPDGRLE